MTGAPSRRLVPRGVTLATLLHLAMEIKEGGPHREADLFVGSWLAVSARFNLVAQAGDRLAVFLCLADKDGVLWPFIGARIFFGDEWRDHLLGFARGAPITFLGRIDRIDAFGPLLASCELVLETTPELDASN